jgi:hypothetical protein
VAKLKSLLIAASEIPGATFTLTRATPLSETDGVGIYGLFGGEQNNLALSDILVHLPTAAAASKGIASTQSLVASTITSKGQVGSVSVGTQGKFFTGTSSSGSVSYLIFGEGNYIVTMEFTSRKASEAVPENIAVEVATDQDAILKGAH